MAKKASDKEKSKAEETGSSKNGSRKPSIPKMRILKMRKTSSWRGFLIYAILGIIIFAFFALTSNPSSKFVDVKPISTVISDIKDNKVKSILLDGDKINVTLSDE